MTEALVLGTVFIIAAGVVAGSIKSGRTQPMDHDDWQSHSRKEEHWNYYHDDDFNQ